MLQDAPDGIDAWMIQSPCFLRAGRALVLVSNEPFPEDGPTTKHGALRDNRSCFGRLRRGLLLGGSNARKRSVLQFVEDAAGDAADGRHQGVCAGIARALAEEIEGGSRVLEEVSDFRRYAMQAFAEAILLFQHQRGLVHRRNGKTKPYRGRGVGRCVPICW